MTGLPESLSNDSTTVYGVVIHTKEGTDYGMRHLENIWRKTNIAWASGFTETTHGNELSPYHYESMMGQNITGVTYYTSEGTMEITFTDAVYVPVKFEQEISVAEGAKTDDIDVAVNGLDALPVDYDARYTVSGQDNDDSVMFTVVNGKMTWTGSPVAGKYTLKIEDQSGKYASVEVSFVLSTSNVPVQVQANEDGSYQLAATENVSENQVKAYVKSIIAVKVGDTTYAATGRGAVKIIKDDGTIDLSAKANGKYIFESEKNTNISITATGYPQVDGTVTAPIRYQYVLMNIPYAEFYANESENNTIEADAVSSATKKKPLNKSMTAGTYHTELDGSVISGVTYPVKINEKALESFTKANNEDDLYGNADHAYYVLDQEPSYYKEATVENGNVSFGKNVNEKEVKEYTSDANVSMTLLEGNHNMHGDYEMRFSDLPDDCILRDTNTVVYGAVLHTSLNGTSKDYGLRYQENIFHHKKNNFEIAWATGSGDGFQTTVKGAELSYEPYADMMGRSLTGLTVYTDQGIIEITLQNEKYVPIKQNYDITVTAPEVNATETTYAGTEPFANAQITVTDADDQEVEGITVDTVNKKISWTEDLAAGTYKLVFTDPSGKYASISVPFTVKFSTVYVLMNIPYADFYDSEINGNDEDVDAVSSATHAKPRTGSLVGGSYHVNSDGSDISGITFPVKVSDAAELAGLKKVTDEDSVTITVTNRGQTNTTTYTGKDALFENENFAYYELSETPSYYKELTVSDGELTFSEVKGAKEDADNVTARLLTDSSYGDYQLSMSGLPDSLSEDSTTVYGVVLHTEEGSDYGMRHLENIWRKTNIAWASGFTETVHGCPLAPDHYKSMMGKHLTGATYYTNEGMIEISFEEKVYVPVKFEPVIEVPEVKASSKEAKINGLETLPEGYVPEYVVTDANGEEVSEFKVDNDTITWTDGIAAGSYTLNVSDQSGKYASFEKDFVLSSSVESVTIKGNKIVIDEDELDAYRNAVSTVIVDGNTVAGVKGTELINEDGSINFDVKAGTHGKPSAVFAEGAEDNYKLEIKANGYPDVEATDVGKDYGPDVEIEASAEVEDFEYTAKVKVTVNSRGEVVSVEDNDTDTDGNDSFWKRAKKKFDIFKGATKDTISDVDVDIKSGATYSLTAVKKAVANALGADIDTQLAAINISAAPAEVKFYKNEEVVKTVEVDADELDALGSLEILDVALDPKYEKDWNEFTVVVVDEEGNELENEATVVDDTFTVIFADGREIVISFNFDTEEKEAEEVPAADKAEEVSDSEVSDPKDPENEVKEEEKADDPSSDEENEDADAADDQDTEEKEDTEEAEDKSEETEDPAEDVAEEDKSEETEDSTEDAASDDKEDAPEVPEVGESTEGTAVEETETLSKDGE